MKRSNILECRTYITNTLRGKIKVQFKTNEDERIYLQYMKHLNQI